MSTNGQQRRTRLERVAALELPPSLAERAMERLRHGDVLLRIALCAVAALLMWGIIGGWRPPFPFRTGYTPLRDIECRTTFTRPNAKLTEDAREKARSLARFVYVNDPSPLRQLRAELKNAMAKIASAETLQSLPAGLWAEFSPPPMPNVEPASLEQQQAEYQKLRSLVETRAKASEFELTLGKSFAEIEQKGIIREFPSFKDPSIKSAAGVQGNLTQIEVHPPGDAQWSTILPTSEVLFDEAAARLNGHLKESFGADVAARLFNWIRPKLVDTLTLDKEATKKSRDEAAAKVEEIVDTFEAGEAELAAANVPIDPVTLELLRAEHDATLSKMTFGQYAIRSLAVLGMFAALYALSGFYIFFRDRTLLQDLRKFLKVLALFVGSVALCHMAATNTLRAEIVPILLFGMIVGTAYHAELALLLTGQLALVVILSLGQGLSEFVVLFSAAVTSILLLGRIRTRSRLIYVGLIAGAATSLTAIGVGIVDGQPLNLHLLQGGLIEGAWVIGAAILMLGLLPFIENMFDVMTDLRLLEIGDPSHPLLQELVRRAPGTYNHSINVASLAESACEAIGARGLLARVGAYFHDIGKMLKPGYFVENQGREGSRHETLLPAMSTLVIIAHIKDGADLARQHHLPQPLIDFIQQHHGTTLVEYFYRRANEQSERDPNGAEVDESAFRYPGPKPQTKEAGVLMLADASESASRALVDPTPARLESLVHDLSLKRLLDGQFDECGLTLQELQLIEESLVKSLTANYHGRVKYHDQRTA